MIQFLPNLSPETADSRVTVTVIVSEVGDSKCKTIQKLYSLLKTVNIFEQN